MNESVYLWDLEHCQQVTVSEVSRSSVSSIPLPMALAVDTGNPFLSGFPPCRWWVEKAPLFMCVLGVPFPSAEEWTPARSDRRVLVLRQ